MAQEDDSDDELVARAGRGDRVAASHLVLRHTNKIYAATYRMLGVREAAEDATQETFVRMWRHAANWQPGRAKFESWLYKVAMNICLDLLRKRGREIDEDAAPERADAHPQPEQSLLIKQRASQIDEALKELPDRQRMAITLCHYQEVTNIEAAGIMNVSVDALESLLARGRRNLRERLAPMREQLTGADYDRTQNAV